MILDNLLDDSAIREIALPTARGTLAALRAGNRLGPPLLAVHGWLDNAASFLPLLPWLAEFDLVAIDLPGHGKSSHYAPGYDYAFVEWLHDVLDALDALGWQQANLLGHSLGGAIASCTAAAAPDRVRRLALIEALGPLGGEPVDAGQRLRHAVQSRRAREVRPPRLIADIDSAVAARLAATPMPAAAARLIVERNLQPVAGGLVWRSDPRLTLPGPLRLPETAVHAILRTLTAPTLLIAADPAPSYFTPAIRQARIDCVASIETQVISGGHHLHMEQPERIGPLLADFFRSSSSDQAG